MSEIHVDVIQKGDKVTMVDNLLVTDGTFECAQCSYSSFKM
ncbi:hypothetical protein BTN49_2139 [Candidatus Enterovibrio escicola]|uniref:Uncharacterized protein n=1 Tax=Candidatus Enterovibrio escicola TaxID=1927127 RepID=A0A2A5T267_9GAMM|nr:hypothetical protein BTN49_2139 [Candidatus Enterovibrio escacola]